MIAAAAAVSFSGSLRRVFFAAADNVSNGEGGVVSK
jgi:hypothetical protein